MWLGDSGLYDITTKEVLMEFEANGDGITHINIYSKGKTDLGRFLSNFAYSPILTVDGNFNSIEGYWYWLSNHDDVMRPSYGFNAKKVGRTLPRLFELTTEEFQLKIREACWIKLHSNKLMLDLLVTSTEPFAHYYVFGNDFAKNAGFGWILDMWEQFRAYIRNGYQ
jgi:hypothetical protein